MAQSATNPPHHASWRFKTPPGFALVLARLLSTHTARFLGSKCNSRSAGKYSIDGARERLVRLKATEMQRHEVRENFRSCQQMSCPEKMGRLPTPRYFSFAKNDTVDLTKPNSLTSEPNGVRHKKEWPPDISNARG